MGSLLDWVSRVVDLPQEWPNDFISPFDLRLYSWLAWLCDAIDFFTVSLTVVRLGTQFNRSTHDIVSLICSNSPHCTLLTFLHEPDDCHYPHLIAPSRWCRKQRSLCPPAMPLAHPNHRSSSVSSPTDMVESGPLLPICSSSPSSLLAPASSKPSNSSSSHEVSSVSAWEVSGV